MSSTKEKNELGFLMIFYPCDGVCQSISIVCLVDLVMSSLSYLYLDLSFPGTSLFYKFY